MVFAARYIIPKSFPPVKAYLHTLEMNRAWGPLPASNNAPRHLRDVLMDYQDSFSGFEFLIAGLWGRNDKRGGIDKVIDIFGFQKIPSDKWPGNPEVSVLIHEKGSLFVPQKEHTCGDTLIMLGIEEAFRRTTTSLEEYFASS